jgi:hypothetical protein
MMPNTRPRHTPCSIPRREVNARPLCPAWGQTGAQKEQPGAQNETPTQPRAIRILEVARVHGAAATQITLSAACRGTLAAEERWRHQRDRVNLLGRYMLADRREFPCQVVNMSPGGIALIAPVAGNVGDRVIAYVDHLGRLEGHLARLLQNGFAMTILATPRKRDMLAPQLTWLANRSILNLPEDRRHGRFVPKVASARLVMTNGTNIGVRIIDISLSGAGIATVERPNIGATLRSARFPVARCAIWRQARRSSLRGCSGLGRRERDRIVNGAFHGFAGRRRFGP